VKVALSGFALGGCLRVVSSPFCKVGGAFSQVERSVSGTLPHRYLSPAASPCARVEPFFFFSGRNPFLFSSECTESSHLPCLARSPLSWRASVRSCRTPLTPQPFRTIKLYFCALSAGLFCRWLSFSSRLDPFSFSATGFGFLLDSRVYAPALEAVADRRRSEQD